MVLEPEPDLEGEDFELDDPELDDSPPPPPLP